MTSRRSGTASGRRGRAASIPSGCSRSGSSATTPRSRALPRAAGEPGRGRGSSRWAPTACARWPRRRWPRSAGGWVSAKVTRYQDRSAGAAAPDTRGRVVMLLNQLEPSDRQLLRALLVLGVVALALVVGSQIITAFYFFGDIILVFFLAWLIAFVISPVVSWLIEPIPGIADRLPRPCSSTPSSSWSGWRSSSPPRRRWRPRSTSSSARSRTSGQAAGARAAVPGVARVARLHRGRPRAAGQPRAGEPERVRRPARRAAQQVAVASVGILGTLLITFFLSVWMVLDRAQIGAFLFRLVRPRTPRRRVLQTATSRSFGGFLRGQAIMGLSYFFVALTPHLLFGLPLAVLSATTAGVLMAIPFFGHSFVGAAGPRRARVPARGAAADGPDHGHRLVHRDERAPAADHAGRGRHPPDRGPRLGAHRFEGRRHRGGDLRDPDRGRPVGALLPLPEPGEHRAKRCVARCPATRAARRQAGPRREPAPGLDADIEEPPGTPRRPKDAAVRRDRRERRGRRRRGDRGAGRPDMSRERARTERRDSTRTGEPLADSALRGGLGRCARMPARCRTGRPGRGS